MRSFVIIACVVGAVPTSVASHSVLLRSDGRIETSNDRNDNYFRDDLSTKPEDKGPVTLVLFNGNADYNQLFDCWVKRFQSYSSSKALHVVTLDKEALTHANSYSETEHEVVVDESMLALKQSVSFVGDRLDSASHASWPSNAYQRVIWKSIEDRLKSGYSEVLHSDIDAFYMQDPWKMLHDANITDADLVASSSGCFPEDVCKTWKKTIVANPGFMMFRNTPEMLKVLAHLNEVWDKGEVPEDPHEFSDQFMLNRYLAGLGCTWSENKPGGFLRGVCGGLKMAFLPQEMVSQGHIASYISHGRQGPPAALCAASVQKS